VKNNSAPVQLLLDETGRVVNAAIPQSTRAIFVTLCRNRGNHQTIARDARVILSTTTATERRKELRAATSQLAARSLQ